MYTASDAFFEALWELGIIYCFVNLGSDHPSLLESIAKANKDQSKKFPRIITCPNEMVALSMADGYARLTSRPQCVIIHVDVGTQGLGAAVHNASCGRAPVLIFAGLSPVTLDGELPGSRTEYIHWIQDVPDQKQIVSQYCRYTGEVKRGVNIKQMVGRAYQFAMSAPRGPVYLVASREALAEEIEANVLDPRMWQGAGEVALTKEAVKVISEALVEAEEPLIITGYVGRNHAAAQELVKLCDTVRGLRVLDTAGSDMCFPADHPSSLGLRYGVHESINTADVVVVVDCDVPWIPTHIKPKSSARVFHIDCDPLKQQMPVFYLPTEGRWKVDACTAIKQLHLYISAAFPSKLQSEADQRTAALEKSCESRLESITSLAKPPLDGSINIHYLAASIRSAVPRDTIFVIEAVTQVTFVSDQLRCTEPGTWINCGGGGLGWSGGAALGIKLAVGPNKFICQIVGDGTFLFSVPASVYWIAQHYNLPVLTVVLNNKGWNAPRRSLLLMHPDGEGSRASNADLGISFEPGPEYADIAKAATGFELCAKKATSATQFDACLRECVDSVKNGVCAVLDAVLDTPLEGNDREIKAQTAG